MPSASLEGTPTRRRAGLLLAAALVLTPGGAAAQARGERAVTQGDVARATALHDEAKVLYERGEYRLAIARLEAAIRLDPEGKELYYNLAVLHERLLELDAAASYYERYLEMEEDPDLRERVRATLRRINGAKRERAASGGRAEGRAPLARAAPSAAPRPSPSPGPAGVLTRGLLGASAIGLAAGGIFATAAAVRDPGDLPRTGAGVSVDDLRADARAAHTQAIVADVCFAVALTAAAGAAFVHLVVDRPSRRGAGQVGAPRRARGVRF